MDSSTDSFRLFFCLFSPFTVLCDSNFLHNRVGFLYAKRLQNVSSFGELG